MVQDPKISTQTKERFLLLLLSLSLSRKTIVSHTRARVLFHKGEAFFILLKTLSKDLHPDKGKHLGFFLSSFFRASSFEKLGGSFPEEGWSSSSITPLSLSSRSRYSRLYLLRPMMPFFFRLSSRYVARSCDDNGVFNDFPPLFFSFFSLFLCFSFSFLFEHCGGGG